MRNMQWTFPVTRATTFVTNRDMSKAVNLHLPEKISKTPDSVVTKGVGRALGPATEGGAGLSARWGGTLSVRRRPRVFSAHALTTGARLRYSPPKALRVKRLIATAGSSEPRRCPEDGQFFIRLIQSERGLLPTKMSKSHHLRWPDTRMAFEDYISPEIWVPLMGCTIVSEHQVMSVEYADHQVVVVSHIRIGSKHQVDMALCAYLNYCEQYKMIAIRGVDGQLYSGDPKCIEWRGAEVS